MSDDPPATIAVLGAAGLIGHAVAIELVRACYSVVPVARRFTAAQKAAFQDAWVECPITALTAAASARLLRERRVGIVVNCLGILQDRGRERTRDVHFDFVARLLEALGAQPEPCMLVHLSVPGRASEDRTPFSRSKRQAERLIAAASVPFVILRPGFVIAPAAYGGSALIRALAALPLDLPERLCQRPFAVTDVLDIARTVAVVARSRQRGEGSPDTAWDVMERYPSSLDGVVDAFRRRFGGPAPVLRVPFWLTAAGARAGDLVALLGWQPPIRSTALAELQRGVTGHPEPWIAATGIEPVPLDDALARLPATVQEKWFSRLYLAKAASIGALVVFWCVSGLIALAPAFDAAAAILTSHGFAPGPARAITVVSSLVDVAIGVAIAVRRTCRAGLLAGLAVSIAYMIGAALIAPALWLEPLGALVKTGPAIVLMLVALAILDAR